MVRVDASSSFQTHPVPNPEANEPVILPLLMLTTESLETQDPSLPLTDDGFAAPPEVVNARENDTLTSNWHDTDPGAGPSYPGSVALLADAGTAGVSTTPMEAAKNTAKKGPRLITAPPGRVTCRLYDSTPIPPP